MKATNIKNKNEKDNIKEFLKEQIDLPYTDDANILSTSSKVKDKRNTNKKTKNTKKHILENSPISYGTVQKRVKIKKTNKAYTNKQVNDKLAIFLCFLYFRYINLRIFLCNSELISHIKTFKI